MSTLVLWMFSLTLSLCAAILTAASGWPAVHMCFVALVTLGISIVGIQEFRKLKDAGAGQSARAACTSRYIGLVWIWSGIVTFAIYNFKILVWREWIYFVIGMLIVGGFCIWLAILFDRDEAAKREDESMLGLARTLNLVQFCGMLIAMIGLVVDGKFRFGLGPFKSDWAANNVFFFGALAVACIGAYALVSEKKTVRPS